LDHFYELGRLANPGFGSIVTDDLPSMSTIDPMPHFAARGASDAKEANRIGPNAPTVPLDQVGSNTVETPNKLASEGFSSKGWPRQNNGIDLV
jgi:hypothetical protein